MTRILMVLRPDEGGAFRHVADLAGGLVAEGHEVGVCGPLSHRAARLAAPVLPLEIAREISLAGDTRSLWDLARVVRRFRPDLIHAHGSKGSVLARLQRPLTPGTPVVCTPHGYPFAGYFTSAMAKRRYRAIERGLSRLATRVICVCEAERRLACSVGPCERTRVVYNGTAPDPRAEPLPAIAELRRRGGPVVAAVSGLRPGKGLETLLEAWAQIAPARAAAALAIAGDGPERPALESLIGSLGIGESVHLLGETDGAEPVLAGADVFVNPSWAESFPYAVLEAMALARPIVATDVGGVGEAIEDGVSGRLVRAGDPEALAAAIAQLLDNPPQASELGAAARERHAARFSLERMIQGTLAVYRELWDEKASAGFSTN